MKCKHTHPSHQEVALSHCGYNSRTGLAERQYRKISAAMDVWCLPKPIFTPLSILHYKEFWQRWRKFCVKKKRAHEMEFYSVSLVILLIACCQGPPLVRTEGWCSLSSLAHILYIISWDFASSSGHSLYFVTNKDHLLTENYRVQRKIKSSLCAPNWNRSQR